MSQVLCVKFLLCWNRDGENTIDSLACFAAIKLVVHDVYDLLYAFSSCFRVTIVSVSCLVASNKLELEVLDVFLALGVVGNDSHLDLFTEIVLVLVKENLGNGGGSIAETHATANLTLKIELEVKFRGLDCWSEHVEGCAASKSGYAIFN